MNFLFKIVDKHRKAVIIFFAVMVPLCAIMFLGVRINYNMTDYLPDDANSTQALSVMEKEFEEPIPNMNVMVPSVSIEQALDYKAKLEALDTVKDVMWLNDAVDLKQPLETQDKATVETYYKDNNALFSVTVKNGSEKDAVNEIRKVIGKTGKISGTAADQAQGQLLASSETTTAMLILVPLIILLLILSTASWLEPLIYLATIGVAVVLNLGTDLFLGSVSYITLTVAPILQLAVSIDYAIFLSHRFNTIRQDNPDIRGSMKEAMKKSFPSIAASAAATLFGFVGLLFMKFKIGPDMGISLVKGILISFICVMTLLPALTLALHKAIDKTKHPRFMPNFKNIGNGVNIIKIPFFILVMIIIVPCFLAQSHNSFTYGTGNVVKPGSDTYAIEQEFGKTNTLVMLVPYGDSTKETLLGQKLQDMNHVKSVISYASMVSNKIPPQYLSRDVVSKFYSKNYARIIIYTDTEYEGETAFKLVQDIKAAAGSYYGGNVLMCGYSPNLYDMKAFIEKDDITVEIISLVTIFIVLLFTFKSWLLPILILLTIKASTWINMAIPYFTGSTFNYIGYLVISTVQLAATVDYAILLTDYYMANRRFMGRIDAMKKTLGEMVQAILVSGLILSISGFCLGLVSTNVVVSELGMLLGRGALIPLVLVVVFLPMLLVIFDKAIPYTTRHADFYKEPRLKPGRSNNF